MTSSSTLFGRILGTSGSHNWLIKNDNVRLLAVLCKSRQNRRPGSVAGDSPAVHQRKAMRLALCSVGLYESKRKFVGRHSPIAGRKVARIGRIAQELALGFEHETRLL